MKLPKQDVVTNDGDETTHLDVVTNDDERIDDNEDLEQDVIAVGFEGASSIEKQVKLCKGFIIQYNNDQESFYRIYPFHRHSSEDPSLQLNHHISISYDEVSHNETLVIHSSSCTRALDDPTTESNKCCLDIEHPQQFKKMLEMSSESTLHSKCKLDTLNYQQLQIKYRNLEEQFNEEKLHNLNLLRKNSLLHQKYTLNSMFNELIASAEIPRLKVLLQVCFQRGMGMKSIIGRIEDAINKKYSPKKYGDVDWEKAILVLRIGGPRLLHLLHVTDGLLVVSSVYKKCKTLTTNMVAGVDSSFEHRHNMGSFTHEATTVSSLKMDEIAVENRLRWNKQDNKIYGLCYQHSHRYDMEFCDISSISNLQNLLATNTVHKTKENLVIAIGNVCDRGHITPLFSLPSCCKDETDQFPIVIDAVCNHTNVDIIATDGDATRRRILSGMMKHVQDNGMHMIMKKMPLFDLYLINGKRALYFDDKHNGKRMRTTVISDTRGSKIDGKVISKDQLKHVSRLV